MNEVIINIQHPLYQEDLRNVVDIEGIRWINDKRVLITGATGLIGKCLIDALMYLNEQGANIQIYALGRSLEKGCHRFRDYFNHKHFTFIEKNDWDMLPRGINYDVIVPLASFTHPLAYSQYPVETIEVNVKGAEIALRKARECGAIVLYPSSVEIYGQSINGELFAEDSTGILNLSNSRSCYTESKRVCEALCQSYAAEYGVNVKIVRLSRVFGPTMLLTDSKASSQFLKKALNYEDIILKSQGDQLFSYSYVADAVRALLYVLIYGKKGMAYNVSSDRCTLRLRDFAETCAKWANRKVVMSLPSESEKKGYSIASFAVLDNNRIKKLGWNGIYNADDAIFRTLEILKDASKYD